jgi:hypothetical protein
MFQRLLLVAVCPLLVVHLATAAAPPAAEGSYFDESTQRHLTVTRGEFDGLRVSVRFAGDPGSEARWEGLGRLQGKLLAIAPVVGEDQTPGVYFTGRLSETKLEVGFKPDQGNPQDMGINGSYRRVSEAKLLQLARKEAEAAADRLAAAWKNAAKQRPAKERAAFAAWKAQWPEMQARWIALAAPAAAPSADREFARAHALARAYAFVETLPDPAASEGWEGEYDDFGGGHASLRLGRDGSLRLNMNCFRLNETATGELSAVAAPAAQGTSADGSLTAELTVSRQADTPAHVPAQIRLVKLGRYLRIETEPAIQESSRGWFDGLYRGHPVPAG